MSSIEADIGRENTVTLFTDNAHLINRNRNRSCTLARHGMVCASQPLAAMAGLDVLKGGGNAIDAAVAANAMLGLVEPMMCGPGGDLFAIVWSEKDQRLFGLNASGRAPHDWSIEEAQRLGLTRISPHSPMAWSVPGCVSGWEALLDRFGTRSLSELLAPSIETARAGFPVSPRIAWDWIFPAERHAELAETYLDGGTAPAFGDIVTNPQLASFYETLANEGARSFYEGAIAEQIVGYSKAVGGYFSQCDFTEHTADWVEPVSVNYRGYDVWELPPNGQGIAALQMLALLEQFDVAALKPNSAAHLHLLIEAKRLAYEDRARYYADPEFARVPVEALLSAEYAKERSRTIDPAHAMPGVTFGMPESGSDTIYLTTADAEGNMVSLIQSIYYQWGSRFVPARLGFALQNRGCAFSLDPAHPNALEPGKRPFHTIIPAFMTKDGAPVCSFGVVGGEFQPQGHAQIVMNLVDFGMDPQQSGEQARATHTGSSDPNGFRATGPGIVRLEHGIPDATRAALAELGHRVAMTAGVYGGYQGLGRLENPRRYLGGSDPRKDGCALGL